MSGKPSRSAQRHIPAAHGRTPTPTISALGEPFTGLSPEDGDHDPQDDQYQNQDDSREEEANTTQDKILPSTLPSSSSQTRQKWGKPGLFAPFKGFTSTNPLNPITVSTSQLPGQHTPILTQGESEAVTTLAGIIGGAPATISTQLVQRPTAEPEEPLITVINDNWESSPDDPYSRIYAQYFSKALAKMATALGKEIPAPYCSDTMKDLPEIPVATLLSEILTKELHPKDMRGMAPDYSRLWQRRRKPLNLPWEQALRKYKTCSEKEIKDWLDADVLYPLPISTFLHVSSIETRQEFKTNAFTTINKWRSPTDALTKVYPLEQDWREGDSSQCLKDKEFIISMTLETLSFNMVQGLDESGRQIVKYFIMEH